MAEARGVGAGGSVRARGQLLRDGLQASGNTYNRIVFSAYVGICVVLRSVCAVRRADLGDGAVQAPSELSVAQSE
eukprot:1751743-Rhodomonas_salina.2